MLRNVIGWLNRRSKASLIATALIYVALVGTADSLTPAAVIFAIFYLPAIMLVTWFAGKAAGILIATASGVAWLIVGWMLAAPGSPTFIPYWNAINGFAVFLAVVYLLSAVKGLNEQLEERVDLRTAELRASIAEHRRTEDRLRTSEERFRQLAEGINEVFWMTDIENGNVIYVSPAYEMVWGRTCASWYESPGSRLEAVHPEDRDRIMQVAESQRSRDGYNEEYRIVRPDGAVRWVHDRAFPVYDKTGAVYRLGGIAEDITPRKRLEKKVLEVSDQEQRRIGQDLHDGLCQHLTATMFASKILAEKLALKSMTEAAQAAQIAEFIEQAISQARNVARGLDPVKVATNGLMSALEELAATIQGLYRIRCVFRSDGAALVDDHAAAIHLYRIAQEAVNNAVKHGKPTQIEIGLDTVGEKLILTIQDDGVGLRESSDRRDGLGQHTMNYRANMIGASLQFHRRASTGTVVTCTVPKNLVVSPNKEGV